MPNRELVFEDNIWQWKDPETGELTPLTQVEVLEQQDLGTIPRGGQEAATAAYLAWVEAQEAEKTPFWDEYPDEYNRWQQWNAQQTLAGGPTLGSGQAEAAFGYMEPFGLEDFGQALTLYAGYLYEPGLGIPMPSQAAQYVAAGGDVRTVQAQAEEWAATRMTPAGPPSAAAAPPSAEQMGVSQEVYDLVQEFATAEGIPFEFLMGIVLAESGGDPLAGGDGGASIGLLQLLDEIVIDGKTYQGQGAGMSVEERQDPRRNLEVGVPPIAQAYQQAIAMGLSGDELLLYVANYSGHPSSSGGVTVESPAFQNLQRGQAAAGAAGAGPAGPGGWPTGPYVLTEIPSRTELTEAEELEWAEMNALTGMPKNVYILAKDKGLDPLAYWDEVQVEQRLYDYQQILPGLTARYGTEWTDEDLRAAAELQMSPEELTWAAQAQQAPKEWWDKREAQIDETLKGLGLTREDWATAQQYGIALDDYQVMLDLGMRPQQWNAALDRLGSADAIWQASQLGYDPATMNPAQIARYELRTDVDLQIMRAAEAIPEAVRPDISALSPAITNRYDLRRAEARTEGRYLSPGDFLGEEYPGLFGGGTAQQLRADLEGIMGEVETQRPLTRAERLAHPARARISPLGAAMGAGLTRRGAGIQLPYFAGRPGTRYGPEENILREMPTTTRTVEGEMLYQRGLAQAMIEAPEHRQPENIERIRARYPELARRAEAGEHETEEQKRLRRLKGRLQPAGRSTGRVGYTPPQVVNFPR